ncbi:NAD(P)-dependent oxidoreductase [Pseudoclavibacter soli]|uniref:NAD(P)-dependent oxidoreductase n=1 Tax=Pseudoclavibacter soli TaxID=452623 RepID=UPI0006860555|nr:NAD(P)-dependent oxidoreductase [Pseudoclavibacter soli]
MTAETPETALLLRVDQTDEEVEHIRALVERRGLRLVVLPPGAVELGERCDLLLAAPASPVDEQLLDRLRGTRWIATPSVGVDHIDVGRAHALGMQVRSAPGYNAVEVAEYALTGVQVLLKDLLRGSSMVREQRWWCRSLEPIALSDAVVGLVGFGTIARHLATRLHELGVRTLVWNRSSIARHPESAYVEVYESMSDLVSASDVVSLHVPLTASTAGLVGPRFLSWMRPGAGLVNTARGGLLDAVQVSRALADGRLRGAVLDVLEHEPPDWRADPLLSAPNTMITPHQAWLTPGSRYRGWDVSIAAALDPQELS